MKVIEAMNHEQIVKLFDTFEWVNECEDCPIRQFCDSTNFTTCDNTLIKYLNSEVTEPRTRMSEFLKIFPDSPVCITASEKKFINICPLHLDKNFECSNSDSIGCSCIDDCKVPYWNEVLPDE